MNSSFLLEISNKSYAAPNNFDILSRSNISMSGSRAANNNQPKFQCSAALGMAKSMTAHTLVCLLAIESTVGPVII